MSNWAQERIREAIMWPVNLIRDLPKRSQRLLQTLLIGLNGVLFFFPNLFKAIANGTVSPWLRFVFRRVAFWCHRLLNELFDLMGGPELGQFLMHLVMPTTPLTTEEKSMIQAILGPDALRFDDVRVAEGGFLDWIFARNGNLAFATWYTINLPRTGRHTRENKGIVVHELTHVYQYHTVGSRYLGEAIYMLIKTKRDCYNYGGPQGLATACSNGRCYADYNREQQAMITQDYYSLQQKGVDVAPYEPFIAQVRAGAL